VKLSVDAIQFLVLEKSVIMGEDIAALYAANAEALKTREPDEVAGAEKRTRRQSGM
jgi:hypothetical protein